jgi:hypothetical protein
VYYYPCVTTLLTIRLRGPEVKERLRRAAKPNVNAWLNALIERELPEPGPDWREILKRDRPKSSASAYAACLRPE